MFGLLLCKDVPVLSRQLSVFLFSGAFKVGAFSHSKLLRNQVSVLPFSLTIKHFCNSEGLNYLCPANCLIMIMLN